MSKGRRIAIWSAASLIAVTVLVAGLKGCTLMPWNRAPARDSEVSVLVTRDFGRTAIKSGTVGLAPGDSCLDAVQRCAEVETGYGGAFVSSIEGLRSGKETGAKDDWFYYVNGVLPGIGAGDFELAAGDRVWWDYHGWSENNFVPAVVGQYPAPFTRALSKESKPTRIVSGVLEAPARDVGDYLEAQGARVSYSGDVEGFEKDAEEGPALAVVTFEEARGTGWIKSMLENRKKTGVFVALEEGGLVPLDENGAASPPGEDAVAAVVAAGSGMGDESPVWLVLCRDPESAGRAVGLLTGGPDELRGRVGVVIGAVGTVYPLPMQVEDETNLQE